jgi:glycyl-tRNA synthetase
VQSDNPAGAARAIRQLSAWVAREDWHEILPAFARCVRITRDQEQTFKVNEKAFVETEEKLLYAALKKVVNGQPATVDEFLEIVAKLVPAINTFFDKVLVMTDDEKIRQNRLALVGQIADLSHGVGDMSKLEGF